MANHGNEHIQTKSGKLIEIRPLVGTDVGMYLDFYRTISSESTNTYKLTGAEPDTAQVAEIWERDRHDPLTLRLGAFDQDRLVAQLILFGSPPLNHPWTKHRARFAMAVIQEFWGQGIARKLLEKMEQHARAQGIIRIEAEVRADNTRGIGLYTKFGFHIEGTRKSASLINGELRDEYYIAKILSPTKE
jgi:RimJ/RimL family protein N-acetyltransferase